MSPDGPRASVRPSRWGFGLGAIFTASCLLTKSLDGLEGPPLSPDGGVNDGAAGADAGASDTADGTSGDVGAGGGAADGGFDDGGGAEDAPILDGDGGGDGNGPIVIARPTGIPRGIAEHGENVYWVQTEMNAGIARAPKHGAGMSGFVDSTSNAFDVAVDSEYVYWSTGRNGEVYRKSILADAASRGDFYFAGAAETLFLAAATGGRIYVTGFNTVGVGPRPDAGYSEGIYSTEPGAAGIAIFGMHVFWSRNTGIVRGTETGQPRDAATIYAAATPGEVGGIATDGKEMYWTAPGGVVRALLLDDPAALPREVCRSIVDGDAESDARPDGDGGTAIIADIAVDDEWVYFTEPRLRQIIKCRKH
jgi:hypothetical protein